MWRVEVVTIRHIAHEAQILVRYRAHVGRVIGILDVQLAREDALVTEHLDKSVNLFHISTHSVVVFAVHASNC